MAFKAFKTNPAAMLAKILLRKYRENLKFGFKRIKMAPKRTKVVKAKIDLTKGSRNAKMSPYISPMKSIVSSKKSENKLIKSSQKSKIIPIRDPATKRDIELMQQKI